MTEWKKIICGVDFSELSRLAMQEAAELAKRVDAELTLVHVFPPPRQAAIGLDMLASEPEIVTAQIAEELTEKMAGWRDEAARLRGAPVDAKVIPGDPAEELTRVARETGSALIVVSTHGRSGIKRLLLGSVAERVVREAPCQVLVVRRAA